MILLLADCSCSGDGNAALTVIVTGIVFMAAMNLKKIRKGGPFIMKNWKIIIVLLLVAVVAAVVIMKKGGASSPITAVDANNTAQKVAAESNMPASALPRLVDLGAGKCIPCKMMAPILEELKTEYKGRLDVVFYDVWENPDQAKKFAINIIPTQIFFDASGKELFRHEGFMSREDILAKWKEFGISFEKEVK